nr:MAG TPA: hypothetical protein [Caudoviricetes sp.]
MQFPYQCILSVIRQLISCALLYQYYRFVLLIL